MRRRTRERARAIVASLSLLAVPALAQQSAPASAAAAASSAAAAWTPIVPVSQCLDPSAIDRWQRMDAQRVLVATRAKAHYELRFGDACAGRDKPAAWEMSTQAPSRLCGYTGETALDAEGNLCSLSGVRVLDTTQYEALRARAGG